MNSGKNSSVRDCANAEGSSGGSMLGEMQAKQIASEEYERERAVRYTPWEKATIEQKLEKLRIAGREQGRALTYIAKQAREAKELAEVHVHGPSGEVFVRAAERINRLAEGGIAAVDILA